jgi:hypothetical protein
MNRRLICVGENGMGVMMENKKVHELFGHPRVNNVSSVLGDICNIV